MRWPILIPLSVCLAAGGITLLVFALGATLTAVLLGGASGAFFARGLCRKLKVGWGWSTDLRTDLAKCLIYAALLLIAVHLFAGLAHRAYVLAVVVTGLVALKSLWRDLDGMELGIVGMSTAASMWLAAIGVAQFSPAL